MEFSEFRAMRTRPTAPDMQTPKNSQLDFHHWFRQWPQPARTALRKG